MLLGKLSIIAGLSRVVALVWVSSPTISTIAPSKGGGDKPRYTWNT